MLGNHQQIGKVMIWLYNPQAQDYNKLNHETYFKNIEKEVTEGLQKLQNKLGKRVWIL